jgi:hypothetical protein
MVVGVGVVMLVIPCPMVVPMFENGLHAGGHGHFGCRLWIQLLAEQQHQGGAQERE